MAKIDDLKVATDALSVTVTAVEQKVDELKAGNGNIDPKLDAAIAAVNDANTRLNAKIQ